MDNTKTDKTQQPEIDQRETFVRFIKRKHRDVSGYIELRPCFEYRQGIDTNARRWFTPEEFIEKSPMFLEYCRRHRLGAFAGVLPRSEKGRGTADSVESGGVLWADIDDKDHNGSRDVVWTLVRSLPVPPSVVVQSGGGLHLYFFLNTEYPADEIAEMNERIAKMCGGDSCHDKARILRLPTSFHQKNPDNVQFVRFVEYDESIEYTLDELSPLFPPVERSKIIKATKIVHIPVPKLPDEIRQMMNEHVRLNELFEGIGKTGGDQSGTGYDFAFAKECAWLGIPADKICDALAVRIAKRGKRKGSNYILRTVGRAVAVMEQRKNEPIDVTPTNNIQGDANVVLELDRFPDNHRDPSKRNRPKMTSMNLYRILTLDPIFAGSLRFNAFKNRIEIAFNATDIRRGTFQKIADVHSKNLRHQVARNYGLEYKKDVMNDEIQFVAHENTVHPVREYLESLEWDGRERIDHWLTDWANAEITQIGEHPDGTPITNERLISQFGRKFLISAVARVMNAGCKVDTSLILTGKQGAGKSTIFKVLTKNPEWFRDSSINVNGGRDAYSLLSGVWIYEFAELQATRTRDAESVKAFLSSCSDSCRPAYAHYDVDVPRQCVFVGTSNETEILRDPTGNRRFWVVRVTDDIDLNGFAKMVDLLWSEAVHAYKQGERWWLDDDVDSMFTEHSNQFQSSDSWTTIFENWWDTLTPDVKHVYNTNGLTSLHVLTSVIGLEVDKIGRHHEMRVGGILNGCGFVKRRVRVTVETSNGTKMKRVYKYFQGDDE